GRFLVLAALLFAASGMVTGLVAGARRSREGRGWTERFAYAFSGAMIAANLLMIYALLARDFSVGYVAQVGSTQVPDHIAAISLWSSLEGSILFWGAILGLYVAGFTWTNRGRHPEYMPWALGVLLGVSVFFSFL